MKFACMECTHFWLICFLSLIIVSDIKTQEQHEFAISENYRNTTVAQHLVRRKRYLAFPEGSSISAAICMTVGVLGNPNVDWLSWAVNWGVSYNLPDYNWVKMHVNGFANRTKTETQRRTRRSFFDQVQLAVENMGFNGSACVARALCESSKYLQTTTSGRRVKRGNMIEEIVKTIFSFPRATAESFESDYDDFYQRDVNDCSDAYPGCHFSLLELALGKYTTAPTGKNNLLFM